MDPFSADSELINIHTTFTQSQHSTVLSDYDPTTFSPPNKLPARLLQLRSQCALGQTTTVLSSVTPAEAQSNPSLAAMRAYASHLASPSDPAPIATAQELAEAHGADNADVQLLAGAVLARAGKCDDAVKLLGKHQGSLDAVAMLVQVLLMQNRVDLAAREAKSARGFAQDALLVNLAEAWVGMREGGDAYQKSFYVFEELAQSPSSASAASLVAQAVSELHMGRVEEAETALNQALALEPENSAALANKTVLDAIVGREAAAAEGRGKLESVDGECELLAGLREKREAFGVAMGKYSPKFEA